MSPIDDELRRVLAAHADDAALQTDPLAGIEREAKSIRRRRTGTAVLGAALSVAVVALAVPSIRTSLDADKRQKLLSTPSDTPSASTHGAPPLNTWAFRGDESVLFDNSSQTAAANAWIKLHHVANRQVVSDVLYADRWSEGTVQAVLMHDPEGQFYNSNGDPVYDNYRLVWYLQVKAQTGRIVFEQSVDVPKPDAVYSLELPGNQTAILPAPGADVTVDLSGREELLGDRPSVLTHDSYDTVRIRAAGSEPTRVNGAADGIPVTAWGPRGARSVVESLQGDAIAALAHDHPEIDTPVALWGGRADSGTRVVLVAGEIRGHGTKPTDSAWVVGAWVQPPSGVGRLVAVHDADNQTVAVSARVLTSADGTSDPWIVVLAMPGAAASYHPADNDFGKEPEEQFVETRWQMEEQGTQQLIDVRFIRNAVFEGSIAGIGQGASYPDI